MCVSERIFSSVFKIPYNSSLLSWYNGCLTAETNALNIKWLTQVSEQRPSHSWTGVGVILDSKWSENSKWVGSLPAKVGGERNFEVESNSLKFFVDIKLFVGFIFLFGYLLVEYQVLRWGSWFIWSLGWYQFLVGMKFLNLYYFGWYENRLIWSFVLVSHFRLISSSWLVWDSWLVWNTWLVSRCWHEVLI